MKKLLAAGVVLAASMVVPLVAEPGAERPMNYRPDGGDFVVENGRHRFNRPLYAGNTGFRSEAGDKPEFGFFFPGRGGNLRFAIMADDAGKSSLWLHEAATVTARYRAGSMIYEIRDPLLGDAGLILTALPAAGMEAILFRVETRGRHRGFRLVWSYGGGDEHPGRRNGDLNAENEPLERYFSFRPEHARGHRYGLRGDGFALPHRKGTLVGVLPVGAKAVITEARHWNAPHELLKPAGRAPGAPVVAGEMPLVEGRPVTMAIHMVRPKQNPGLRAPDLAKAFEASEAFRKSLVGRLEVDTPDPYLNAAASAIPVAADAIWDESQGAYMHGAIGWRVRLLGWRAAYAGDALGWHERTRRHLQGFAKHLDTSPAPESMPPADEIFHLARNETALHSRGDFAAVNPRHYNMNLVGIDTLFRHLMWTGDLDFAREMWPVVELHLERERRLFRRPFGADGLPLYEAYACIWASDELIYNGGGATHATAYNFWHHRMAAKIAEKIGKDPTLYQREAEAIRQGMNRELWLENEGWFAEYRDWLGKRSAHASPGLWTYYHTVDSAAASAFQAWQASRFIDSRLSRIPLHGKGVPAGSFALPTTDWMPYQWSINNVALAESAHTALALWQAGRGDFALPVLKGAFLDAMFMGPCPGNVGMTSQSDRFSGERYRDFADAVGITARAVVEGVFGIQPDLIAGKLRVRPGFPADWEHASLRHAGVSVAFKREDLRESYLIESRLARPAALELVIPALRAEVASVTVNGKELGWRNAESNVGPPRIIIEAAAASRQLVVVTWAGPKPAMPVLAAVQPAGGMVEVDCGPAELLEIHDPQQAMAEVSEDRHGLRARWVGKPGPRTVFVRLRQGGLKWWHALDTEVRPALAIESPAEQTPGCLRMELTSSLSRDMEGPAVVEYAGRKHEFILRLPACGRSGMIELPADGLVPGTHPVRVRLAEGTAVEGEITNWKLKSPADHHWEMIDLGTHFNDQVGSIFRNEYRSPRSPFCSLALPKQGVGGWCHYQATAEVDDRGLRAAARRGGGVVQTPLGIPFRSPAEGRNIIFTSLWDKYPDEAAIPLSGKAGRAVLLMAGSTYAMQCRFDNGEIIARYADGSSARLVLRTPVNWWPIEQDYHIDAFAFSRSEPVPPRLDLKSGSMRILTPAECRSRGAKIPGGAATVLDLPLDAGKELESITLRTLGNEVVIGLLAVTLERVEEASPSDG